MSYTILKTNGNTLATVEEGTINSTACSLALVGRRTSSYGLAIAENFVKLLENHASSAEPEHPLTGQLWFDTANAALKLYNGTDWVIVASFSSNGATLTGYRLVLTCPDGIMPIETDSTTKVTNLNADLLDGYDSAIPATPSTVVVRNGQGEINAVKFNGQATSTVYGDVAERFEASEPVEFGDVVCIGGSKEIRKARGHDIALGVISQYPALEMNSLAGSDSTHPFVGYLGRLPVKIAGVASKGQLIYVSDIPGVATATRPRLAAGVLAEPFGRVLEDKGLSAVSSILCVIGVR